LHDLSPSGIFRRAFKNKAMELDILHSLTAFLCASIGYFLGNRFGRMEAKNEYAKELSQLARESVQRDLELAKLEALIQSAIEQNTQEKR
jgi:hypothetical protein